MERVHEGGCRRLDGAVPAVEPGSRVVIPPGTRHDRWNAGADTAYVILEVDPDQRFEAVQRRFSPRSRPSPGCAG
jgi:hypothetical protein